MYTARQMYSKAIERFEKNKEDIQITLRNGDVNGDEIVAKDLTALGKVKEQWEKMVYYFQIVTIIKPSISSTRKTSLFVFYQHLPKGHGQQSSI